MDTLLYADRLFDGTGAHAIEKPGLLISRGRIAEVGPRARVAPPRGAAVVEYDDCTILPGLIDGHVHLCFAGSGQSLTDLLADDDQALLIRAVHNSQVALRAGVTTVRDLGTRGNVALTLRDSIARGLLPGARILAAGSPITTTGGHCHWLGGEADTDADLRTIVQRLHREGTDVVKVMASGGRMTPGTSLLEPQYTIGQLRIVVKEAQRLHHRVIAHAHSTKSITNAVQAGVDVVEHCSWVSGTAANEVEFDEQTAERMATQRTFMDPTLSSSTLNMTRDSATLTQTRRDAIEMRPHLLAAHRQALAMGVEISAGTDAGAGVVPHHQLPLELGLYVDLLGLSPPQAIQSGTYNVARSSGADKEIGSIQVGRRADLLIVLGDPLQDIQLLQHPLAVYKDGRLEVRRGQLVRC